MKAEFEALDGTAMAELVRAKEVTALELVDAAIARIEALEPRVHALAGTDFERARERAREPGEGPFAGVPFLIKDLLGYPGLRHSLGARFLRDNVAQQGSPYTDAFDAAGLITLGKSTTSELGLLGSTETLLEGVTKNPWNLERSATGSSGGAAAAVASGMVPLAHASDGGGSIRIPASACGLFGFKPSRGRCLPTGFEGGDLLGIIVEHCVSRTVRDSARLLAATEAPGPHPKMGVVEVPLERRLRIGVYDETLLGERPSHEVRRALDATIALLHELGHDVVETSAPPVDGAALSDAFFGAAGASLVGMRAMFEPMIGRSLGADDLEPFTLALIARYEAQPAGFLERAQSLVRAAAEQFLAYLSTFDVLLCPTMPIEPPPLGHLAPTLPEKTLIERTESLAGYTPISSMAGVPAMSVPLFVSSSGIPIGSHFAAGPGEDAMLLGLAYALEAAHDWRSGLPSLERRSYVSVET